MSGHRSRVLREVLLEREIEHLLHDQKFELVVILSQTLLELRVEGEVDAVLDAYDAGSLGHAAAAMLGSYNLTHRTKTFFEVLLGEKFSETIPDEFQGFSKHLELRNRIIHQGVEADESEARASFAAVQAISRKLHELTYRHLGLEQLLEEEERERLIEEGLIDED